MSDIAFIDVEEDDDFIDTDLNITSGSTKLVPGHLFEAKHQVSDYQGDLSERGVFDYFSTPLTLDRSCANRAEEASFQPQNHYYLGPGGSSSLQSSGARKFVEAHRQADTTTSSDEEIRRSSYTSKWVESPSGHKHSIDDSPSLDSQWVKQQYNQHVRQANTQSYDEAVLCDDAKDYLSENRPLSPVSSKETDSVDVASSRSSIRDNEHVLSRHTCDKSHDDGVDRLKAIIDTKKQTLRDSASLHTDTIGSASRNERDVFVDNYDALLHRKSSSGQPWPISAKSCDSYGGHAPGSHQNAVCRSSELSTVVSAVNSVRCSTGVDTGVGFPLSTVSSRSTPGHVDVSQSSSLSGQSTVTSGLDRAHWNTNNYRKMYDDASAPSCIGHPRCKIFYTFFEICYVGNFFCKLELMLRLKVCLCMCVCNCVCTCMYVCMYVCMYHSVAWQCYTVVRVMQQVNGKWQFWGYHNSVTPEPID